MQTLLDVVQGILNKLDSDAVSSIGDTVEADQIADLVRQVYFDIIDEYSLPGQRILTTLEGLSDLTKPNVLKIPDNTSSLLTFEYDTRLTSEDAIRYTPVCYMLPAEFLRMVNQRNSNDTDRFLVVNVVPNVSIITDVTQAPQKWTSFNDEHIVTDSYNAAIESTLQSSKTQVWVEKRHAFEKTDGFVFHLPQNLQSLFYRTAENEAYAIAKQVVNPKLEQKESRLRIRAQRNKHRDTQFGNNTMVGSPNYGRK
jgi:hypothetical protein